MKWPHLILEFPASKQACWYYSLHYTANKKDQKPHSQPRIGASTDGRVVKALDSKSNGLCPRRFESCLVRFFFFFFFFSFFCFVFVFVHLPVALVQSIKYFYCCQSDVFLHAHYKMKAKEGEDVNGHALHNTALLVLIRSLNDLTHI